MAHIKQISFVTFGMFIIDEIEWQTPNPPSPKYNLLGGAGTYAVLGARIASSPCQLVSRSISWIVDVGSDFPEQVRQDLDHWNTDCNFRVNNDRLTTRAWNGYGEGELRAFKYLTPKIRLEVSSLSERQVLSKSFHMVCSPARSLQLTTELAEKRKTLASDAADPIVVWEPIPDVCSPEELEALHRAAAKCSVVSPNHDELRMFFSQDIVAQESQAQLAARLMGWDDGTRGMTVLIVREGAQGSTAYFADGNLVHVPAYHDSSMTEAIVDPTGGGNTYLGAIAIALTDALHGQPTYPVIRRALNLTKPATISQSSLDQLKEKVMIGMVHASVAASFAIEQNGAPNLQQKKVFTEIFESWNNEQMIDRLKRFLNREKSIFMSQPVR